jgi:hypothetical protein
LISATIFGHPAGEGETGRGGVKEACVRRQYGVGRPAHNRVDGRLEGFSTDRLLRFLTALGCDVRITVSESKPRARRRIRVRAG